MCEIYTRAMCEIHSKLTIKTVERHQRSPSGWCLFVTLSRFQTFSHVSTAEFEQVDDS